MKKQRKSKPAIIIASIVSCGVLFSLFIVSFIVDAIAFTKYSKIDCFNDINECVALDSLKVNQKSLNDKYIDDIDYIDSYCYKLNYNDIVFEFYAYEFDSIDTTKKYYSKVNGDTIDDNIEFFCRSNPFSSSLIVRYNTNVYRIKTGGTDNYLEIMRYLNSVFSVNISD